MNLTLDGIPDRFTSHTHGARSAQYKWDQLVRKHKAIVPAVNRSFTLTTPEQQHNVRGDNFAKRSMISRFSSVPCAVALVGAAAFTIGRTERRRMLLVVQEIVLGPPLGTEQQCRDDELKCGTDTLRLRQTNNYSSCSARLFSRWRGCSWQDV